MMSSLSVVGILSVVDVIVSKLFWSIEDYLSRKRLQIAMSGPDETEIFRAVKTFSATISITWYRKAR